MKDKYLLEELYGIFEENGKLFIEDEVIDFVMDEYNLYEEDAIEMIMEAYEEELASLLETVSILVEDYGVEEDEAIELVNENFENELINEEISRGKAVGGAALAIGSAALARHIYKNTKAPVHYRKHKLRRAEEKLQHRKDVRSYMDTVEQTRRRLNDSKGGDGSGKEQSNYQIAKSIADANKKANRKIYRAEKGVSRAERKLADASARYDRVLDRRQQRKDKLKQSYADYKQARRDRKNPPQPEPPKRRFGLRRKPEPQPVKKSRRCR